MSSPEATHANHSAPQANETVQTTRGICGPRCSEPLAYYDPESRSWRMFGVITLWGLTVCLETLPTSGMTVNGKLYRRSPWERHTVENGLSAWPTPTTQEVEHPDLTLTETGRRMSMDGMTSHSLNLADSVRMWPTPTAITRPMEGNVRAYRAKIEAGEMTAAEAEAILGKSVWEAQGKIPAMWPTPTHGKLAGGSGANQRIQDKYDNNEITLEEKKAMQAGNGGRLNPMWVEWLMGFPLGWTDLED